MDQSQIRNFCIIAHVDHGKSTLADRLLELTGTIRMGQNAQYLDQMDIERERGITIKLQPVRMEYEFQISNIKYPISNEKQKEWESKNPSSKYILNLIDTPGHVDFSYEVSRSLAAVEGALLVVDAAQGIEAQTLSNAFLAWDQGLTIIPVINKIDLPAAQVEEVSTALQHTFGFRDDEIIKVSAKTGLNVEQILDAIVTQIPAPKGKVDAPARALIFDSQYDKFKGVICHVRVVDGEFSAQEIYSLIASNANFGSIEVGYFKPELVVQQTLKAGDIGYIATGLKDVGLTRVGDTITNDKSVEPLPGYKTITPMVFAGVFPIMNNDYVRLREALEKLKLNDASLTFEAENSEALGFGFRCGFLGLLHMDVIKERLEREYNLSLILSAPSVKYEVTLTDGEIVDIESPTKMPERSQIAEIREPVVSATIITTETFLGKMIELVNERRGTIVNVDYMDDINGVKRVKISSVIPLSEIITDFFDKLKSLSSGYASLDYELTGMQPVDAIKLDILIAGTMIDALARIVPKEHAERLGRELVERLKEVVPRQSFEVPIQATIGGSSGVPGKIIARTDVKAFRKDVLSGMSGGDRSRKDKLLDKQKEGKKRMKQVGKVELPQEAFLAVLKQD